ncbi:hypothetical protein [Halobacillus mangrovi]
MGKWLAFRGDDGKPARSLCSLWGLASHSIPELYLVPAPSG